MQDAITFTDVAAIVAELSGDPRIGEKFVALVDLTGATTAAMTADEVRAVASSEMVAFHRRAIVAPDPPTFGLARLFGAHREMSYPEERVGVFKTLSEANRWLESGA
jgi:hypothetical protein